MATEEEMVTITYQVPLHVAQAMASKAYCGQKREHDAARAALDARKSKYQLWLERVDVEDATADLACGNHSEATMRIIDYAPAMLLALVDAHASAMINGLRVLAGSIEETIRSVVPADVAAEIFEEES